MNSHVVVHTDAIRQNLSEIKKRAGGSKVVVMVKSNAYGHGLELVVNALDDTADMFGVNSVEELRTIRTISKKPVLILGYVCKHEIEAAVRLNGTLVISDFEHVLEIDRLGKRLRKTIPIHVKVDTGMGRLGMLLHEIPRFLAKLQSMSNISIAGVCSHFSNIEDTVDRTHMKRQLHAFSIACGLFEEAGYRNFATHIENSAGFMEYTREYGSFSLIRVGAALYGQWPSEHLQMKHAQHLALSPTLEWKSIIAHTKLIPEKFPVGYGCSFITTKPTRIAVIPIGYADGYARKLGNKGVVLIHGKRCPILGAISMNMMVADVSDITGVQCEDEVVLIGTQVTERITPEEIAVKAGTTSREITTRIREAIPRIPKQLSAVHQHVKMNCENRKRTR